MRQNVALCGNGLKRNESCPTVICSQKEPECKPATSSSLTSTLSTSLMGLLRTSDTKPTCHEFKFNQFHSCFSIFNRTMSICTKLYILARSTQKYTVSNILRYKELTLCIRQILDSSKFKDLADDNFEFDENCGKFPKWVEKTVGKGEIARYEQFLLIPHCFQMTCTADT